LTKRRDVRRRRMLERHHLNRRNMKFRSGRKGGGQPAGHERDFHGLEMGSHLKNGKRSKKKLRQRGVQDEEREPERTTEPKQDSARHQEICTRIKKRKKHPGSVNREKGGVELPYRKSNLTTWGKVEPNKFYQKSRTLNLIGREGCRQSQVISRSKTVTVPCLGADVRSVSARIGSGAWLFRTKDWRSRSKEGRKKEATKLSVKKRGLESKRRASRAKAPLRIKGA